MQLETVHTLDATLPGEACPNCGAPLAGAYCHACGQKRFTRHDLTVAHFVSHVFHELTHIESNRTIRTFAALAFKPGLLTKEYLAGRHGRYLTPIRVYLTVSAIFFLFAWGPILARNGGTARIEQAVQQLADRQHADVRIVAEQFTHNLKTYAGMARFASALALALCIELLYVRSNRLYVEHLIFAVHYISFSFLLGCAVELLRMGLGAAHLRTPWLGRGSQLLLLVYLFTALRVVYGQGRVVTAGKTVVIAVCEVLLFIASVGLAAAIAITPLLFH